MALESKEAEKEVRRLVGVEHCARAGSSLPTVSPVCPPPGQVTLQSFEGEKFVVSRRVAHM